MEIPKKIVEAIKNNNLIIFAGSGLSQRFGLPSWNKLIEEIINDADNKDYQTLIPVLHSGFMTPIDVLDKIKHERESINRYIANNFKIDTGDFSFHKKILNLSEQIVTTNYDNAFEMASENRISASIYTSKYNVSEINKNSKTYIFKIHGSYIEPDNCILNSDDYKKIYDSETAVVSKLKTLFTEKTILFLGFSFNDPDINLIFGKLDEIFANNNRHFILTTTPEKFSKLDFLEPITVVDYSEIENVIDQCLQVKEDVQIYRQIPQITPIKKIAFLAPNPIDKVIKEDLSKTIKFLDSLELEIYSGTLNLSTISMLQDFDLIIISSKTFKDNIFIEDENLQSKTATVAEILTHIPDENQPVIFILDEEIPIDPLHKAAYVFSHKPAILNRFFYKILRETKLDFAEIEVVMNIDSLLNESVTKGNAKHYSIYDFSNHNNDFGKKFISNIIGRIQEQSAIAIKLLALDKSNRLLNIKASGGIGKTTLLKKVAHDLYIRGYFLDGVVFKSCETVSSLNSFEEVLKDGFLLSNIVNFKEYLIENFSRKKLNKLIILDNFESVTNALSAEELSEAIELLKFASDYSDIAITSREKLSNDDFEDTYSLGQMTTDDALELFQYHYGMVSIDELKTLRIEILEDLLNNNPLAIKLITKSKLKYRSIAELKEQLNNHFFESINEDYSEVFKNSGDLNIERTKSLYQSINYSYCTLNSKEKIAFELLHLFPDGISLTNFKRCFKSRQSKNKITENEFRVLRDKSLIEDFNGTLQLQPIIRRFAEFQFSKKSTEVKINYCSDAYNFNCYVIDVIEFIEKKQTKSMALKIFHSFRNNLFNVMNYVDNIQFDNTDSVMRKEMILNYIYSFSFFIVSEKQHAEFRLKLSELLTFFSECPKADILIKVLQLDSIYFLKEFDLSYQEISKFHTVSEMQNRKPKEETHIEEMYRDIVANIHGMEGYTLQQLECIVKNNNFDYYLIRNFFYLGIVNNISRRKDDFYHFEYQIMLNQLVVKDLEKYIESLYADEHLEKMQSTYILSKVKKLSQTQIQKLVITNPYTRGLKELMLASIEINIEIKEKHFKKALKNLNHIKYYYLEALLHYTMFLKSINNSEFEKTLQDGLNMCREFHYQYLQHQFENVNKTEPNEYLFTFNYYPNASLERYVEKYDIVWAKRFKERIIEEF